MEKSKMFNLPNYKHVVYAINMQTGYFTKTNQQPELTTVQIMPYELKREKTVKSTINAEYSLFKHSYKENNSKEMFTGLQPCNLYNNWFLGNNYKFIKGEKVNEIILIFIAPKNDNLHLFYFADFYKCTDTLRQKFATEVVPILQTKIIQFLEQ